jgi:molybdopterin converting factor small subunit
MSCVRLEVMTGLHGYFGVESSGRVVLEREVSEGTTVGNLLEEIVSQNQGFQQVIFDGTTGGLAGHVFVILNGRLLELSGGLEAKLKEGDTIRLMAGIGGG